MMMYSTNTEITELLFQTIALKFYRLVLYDKQIKQPTAHAFAE